MTTTSDLKDEPIRLPPWLTNHRDTLAERAARNQAPQALLIHGAPGTGRRYLALWYAANLLGLAGGSLARLAEDDPEADAGERELGHPDLLIVTPPPEKSAINVASIRTLIEFLHLRSHQGGARVVLVWPADAMTHSAANSMLKTLEEPPSGSAIVLVATATASLPATILSRCHRVRVNVPSRDKAREWLEREAGSADWDVLLDFAGGAPLRAKALSGAGFAEEAARYANDLRLLRQRRETPVSVAKRWARADADALLHWLYIEATRSLAPDTRYRERRSGSETGKESLQSPPKAPNMALLFDRLREVEVLYRNRARSMNMELQFASILQRWYGETAGD